MTNGIFKQIEEKFGLPSLSRISEVLKQIPDERKLRLVKQIIDSATKIKGSPEELELLLELIRLITMVDIEQLKAVKSITANLLKLVKLLPKEIATKEILAEIKKSLS